MNLPSFEPSPDVIKAEGELAALESKLSSEVGRLHDAAQNIQGRIAQLRSQAAELQLEGADESISRKVQSLALPPFDVASQIKAAHTARLAAVQARSRALEEVKSLAAAYASELSRISTQLSAGAQEVTAHQKQLADARVREEKARQESPPPPPTRKASPPPPPAHFNSAKAGAAAKSARNGRVKMQAAIDLRSDSNFFTGFSTNLSEGGVFVATVNMLPLGSEVDLRFTLPSGPAVDVRGVVRWTREVNDRTPDVFPGLGVQFQDLPDNAAQAIRQFVATRDPLFFPD